ncbi:MAG: hypothetical protein Q9222_001721 [Ikaeria aurantiellina]
MAAAAINRYRSHVAIVLLISALVLLLSASHGFLDSWTWSNARRTLDHHLRPAKLVPAVSESSNSIKSFALPFGREDVAFNFSSFAVKSVLSRPASNPEHWSYQQLVDEGGRYLEAIQAAFDGQPPQTRITLEDLDRHPPKEQVQYTDNALDDINRRWSEPFMELFGRGFPPQGQLRQTQLLQGHYSLTPLAPNNRRELASAMGHELYLLYQNLLMLISLCGTSARSSSRHQVTSKTKVTSNPPAASARQNLSWLAWSIAAPSKTEELRYIAQDVVGDSNSMAIVYFLLTKDKHGAENVSWPGAAYSGESDEFKALLATPKGQDVASLLIKHAGEMKWRLARRELSAHVFSVNDTYSILWDFHSLSPRSLSRRQTQPKQDPHRRRKRTPQSDYDSCRKKGNTAWDEIQGYYEGCPRYKVREFYEEDFTNGWRRTADYEKMSAGGWESIFDTLQAPYMEGQSYYVEAAFDQPFLSPLNLDRDAFPTIYTPIFHQYYIPISKAVIASDLRSPITQATKWYLDNGQVPPPAGLIGDNWVAPLHRWSDVTWLLWKDKGGGDDLQYIGHDFVVNPQSVSVMNLIRERAGKTIEEMAFPGLEYGMNQEEGRALLGTPNGLTGAHLLIDRARDLTGRRDIRINIFWILAKHDTTLSLSLLPILPKSTDDDDGRPRDNTTSGSLSKRDLDAAYNRALCIGKVLWDIATATHEEIKGDQFHSPWPAMLKRIWARNNDQTPLRDDRGSCINRHSWLNELTALNQTDSTHLSKTRGEKTKHLTTSRNLTPHFSLAFFKPELSAIIVQNIHESDGMSTDDPTMLQGELLSIKSINNDDVHQPYLWSEVAWMSDGKISKTSKSLRYICHDYAIDETSTSVLTWIFSQYGQSPGVPFPGLEFGINSEEGQALLGLPNGLALRCSMLGRSKDWRKRDLRAHIWVDSEELNIAWEISPT